LHEFSLFDRNLPELTRGFSAAIDVRRRPTYFQPMNESKGPSAMLALLLLTGGIGLLLVGGIAALYFHAFDTQYTPGYSDKKFKSVKLGDSEQFVIASLGQPFSTQSTKPYSEWIYSGVNQRRFARTGEGSGTYTTIRFDSSGRVESMGGMVQESASTVTFGDGLNYLGLTTAQIDKLIGSSREEIKTRFGLPAATYENKSTKVLRYSRSPSSANYHLRAIGVDKDGKVVRIYREIYWD
jgi:hypothetical protein